MEDRPPYEQFRDQFRAWTQHVMTAGSTGFHESRHEFYGGISWEYEPVVWGFVEENYLRKYRDFFRVDFDWGPTVSRRSPFRVRFTWA